jgi:hypothetical protein
MKFGECKIEAFRERKRMLFEICEALKGSDLINLRIRNEMLNFVACRSRGCIEANIQKQMHWFIP